MEYKQNYNHETEISLISSHTFIALSLLQTTLTYYICYR